MAATDATVSAQGLYPAEHRALRELYATTQQLASHWTRLAERLGGDAAVPLEQGAGVARSLLSELAERTAAHELHGFPAAHGVGRRLAGVRNAGLDLLFERNQALRLAVLDAEHVLLLLAYLRTLAEHRGDSGLAGFHSGWERKLQPAADGAREAAIALGRDPDDAILPTADSALGRAGRGIGNAVGTVGEAIDGSAIGRMARRGGQKP